MGSPKKRDYTQIKTPTTEARRHGEKAKPLKYGGTEAGEEKNEENNPGQAKGKIQTLRKSWR